MRSHGKTGLTDEMQSKWAPIRRMAWQAFPHPQKTSNRIKRGRRRLGRPKKDKSKEKWEGSLEVKWTKTQKRESWEWNWRKGAGKEQLGNELLRKRRRKSLEMGSWGGDGAELRERVS